MNQINLANLNAYTLNLLQASREYKDRKKDKSKVVQLGRYVTSKNGTHEWIPFAKELCACCISNYGNEIRGRNLQEHFCSATHISHLYKVDRTDLVKFDFMLEHMLVSDRNQMVKAISNIINVSR